jgi:hypothetical protein
MPPVGTARPPVASTEVSEAVKSTVKLLDRLHRQEIAPREQERTALAEVVRSVKEAPDRLQARPASHDGPSSQRRLETIQSRIEILDSELVALYRERESVQERLRGFLSGPDGSSLPADLKMVIATLLGLESSASVSAADQSGAEVDDTGEPALEAPRDIPVPEPGAGRQDAALAR